MLIWTTTPWTIPSNLAIAFHPELDYAAYDVDRRAVIVAEALAERVGDAVGRSFGRPVARMKGEQLERIRFRHPLYERDSIGVLGDYVTLDAGTGAVHTAPGHGQRRLQHGREIRPRHLRADRAVGRFPSTPSRCRRPARVRREPEGRGGAHRPRGLAP